MSTKTPIVLIFSRLIIGLIIIVFGILQINNYKILTISLLTIGLLTDIFDGIIARQLNILTQKIGRLDSAIDQIFLLLLPLQLIFNARNFSK